MKGIVVEDQEFWGSVNILSDPIMVGTMNIHCPDSYNRVGFPGGSVVKNLPANAGDNRFDREYPLVVKMATHSSILAWEISWAEEPGREQSIK